MKCKACDKLLTDDDTELCISCFKVDIETNIDNHESSSWDSLFSSADMNEVFELPLSEDNS